jgi:hypothetical protein
VRCDEISRRLASHVVSHEFDHQAWIRTEKRLANHREHVRERIEVCEMGVGAKLPDVYSIGDSLTDDAAISTAVPNM